MRPPALRGAEYRLIYQSFEYLKQISKKVKIMITVIPTELSVYLLGNSNDGINWGSSYGLNGTTFTILSPQPLVLTSCSESENLQDENIYSIDKQKKLLVNPLAQYVSLLKGNETLETTESILFTTAVDDAYTLVALAQRPGYEGSSICTVCTVNAFWRMAKTTVSSNGFTQIKPEMPHQVLDISNKDFRPIQIKPILPSLNEAFLWHHNFTDHMLGLTIAYALAVVPGYLARQGTYGMPIFDLSQLKGQSDITPFRIDTINYGFGYGTRDTPTNLSVTAITAYCLIVIIYISYIIITGHTSIAWNSPTELIMLALQSKEPTDLGHVSVGVDSMDTLRRSVGIRVSTEEVQGTGETKEKLKLVFEDDEENEKRGLTMVVRNRAY
jgi:hypothetical protein